MNASSIEIIDIAILSFEGLNNCGVQSATHLSHNIWMNSPTDEAESWYNPISVYELPWNCRLRTEDWIVIIHVNSLVQVSKKSTLSLLPWRINNSGKQICNNFRTTFMFIPHNRLFKGTFSNGLKLLIIHCMRNCCNLFIFMCLVLSDRQVRSSLYDERHIFLYSFLSIKKLQICTFRYNQRISLNLLLL